MNGTDFMGCAHPIESRCAKWFVTKYPKNKKLKNSFKIKDWSASSLNTNPYGDKSTTARFVVPFISSYAKNSKTEHTPKFKMHTQYKNLSIINEIERFHGGLTPLRIQVCKITKKNSKTNPKSNFEARALWIRTRTGINRLRPDLWYHSFLHTPKTQKLNTHQNSKSMNGTDLWGAHTP